MLCNISTLPQAREESHSAVTEMRVHHGLLYRGPSVLLGLSGSPGTSGYSMCSIQGLYDCHMITQRPLSCSRHSWFLGPIPDWDLPVGCAGLHSPDSHCRGNGMGSCELCVGSPEVSGWAALNPKWLRILSSQDGEPQLKRLPFIWDCDFSFSLPVLPADFLVLEFTLVNPPQLLPAPPWLPYNISHHPLTWWSLNTSQAQFPSLAAYLEQCAMLLATG